MNYCTGKNCQHWGLVPKEFDEQIHVIKCPLDNEYMMIVPGHPKYDAGYLDKDQVNPKLDIYPE